VTTVLCVAADRRELAGLSGHLGAPVRLEWNLDHAVAFKRRERLTIGVANGPGPALVRQAAETALDNVSPDVVVSIGFCGGLNPDLRPGDIFVAERLRCAEPAAEYAVKTPATDRDAFHGTLLSVDRVVATSEEKNSLWAEGCDAVEMEAAGVAAVAAERRLPFYCIRVVSDTSEESFVADLNWARGRDGRFRSLKIVASALKRPARGLPELLRLGRRTRKAAPALGAFLAECDFRDDE
jgi:adenosylhomocysteine nucleosidase